MLGAIYGDKAGSIYEFDQFKKIKSINPKELITDESFYSDDTIETIALIDAIINNKDYEETLRRYINDNENYKPNFKPYFEKPFSPNTMKWAKGEGNANSIGNGAMMRISPIGFLFNTEEDVIKHAKEATIPSHNSNEAVSSATTIALIIYYFRNGLSKEEVFKKLKLKVEYKPFKQFNMTCHETIGNCLYALYESNSFKDAIRIALSMGGDTDTNSCIVGSMAEALYGLTEKEKSDAKKNLPKEYIKILNKVYH